MMSFLDKVTKAVGDVVDKGKKDVDQFMKIQKINGEIGAMETKIAGFKSQIEHAKMEAGGKVLDLLREGTLASAALQPLLEQVTGFEQQIAAEASKIAEKKAEIEKVKVEHDAAHTPASGAAPQPAPPVAPAPPPDAGPAPIATAPVNAPAPATKFCAQCGARLTGGAVCPECGAKLG
jgi:hypothetical protein